MAMARMEGRPSAGAAITGPAQARSDSGGSRPFILVVNGIGTGGGARIAGRDVSGKTGTAQVISTEGSKAAKGRTTADLRDNGWFVFFAPRDNPQIAGVVFVEHSGHGGTWAAPIAKHVMETFFAKQDGRPLPPAPTPKTQPPEAGGDDPVVPPEIAARVANPVNFAN